MTVIAAVAAGGRVWMAADSQMTMDGGTTRWPTGDAKVHRAAVPAGGRDRHDVLVATSGWTALQQAVRHRLEWPRLPAAPSVLAPPFGSQERRKPTDDELAAAWDGWERDLDRWALDVAEALGRLACDRQLVDDDKRPDFDSALLAYDGRLWGLGPWQATRMHRGYEAIGSGALVATGAMWALQDLVATDPLRVVVAACEAACEWDVGCSGPVRWELLAAAPRPQRLRRPRGVAA